MSGISNEIIFYLGLFIVGATVVFGLVYLLFYRIEKRRLNAKFDVEYGESSEKKRM